MIDTVMSLEKEDETNGVEKEIPVKHFFLDFRMLYLKRKLRIICGDPNFEAVLSDNDEGLSLYQLSKFVRKLNIEYSDDIEKQREVRKIIDSIFFQTSWVIKAQLAIYFTFFFIPFITQLMN